MAHLNQSAHLIRHWVKWPLWGWCSCWFLQSRLAYLALVTPGVACPCASYGGWGGVLNSEVLVTSDLISPQICGVSDQTLSRVSLYWTNLAPLGPDQAVYLSAPFPSPFHGWVDLKSHSGDCLVPWCGSYCDQCIIYHPFFVGIPDGIHAHACLLPA